MKLYAAHSRGFDFQNDWYAPLREIGVELGVEFMFPHEQTDDATNTKETMKKYAMMIAEVSHASTGMGIEIGWADATGIPIVLVHRTDVPVSSSLLSLNAPVLAYTNVSELKANLSRVLREMLKDL